jgi:hypothetical protein
MDFVAATTGPEYQHCGPIMCLMQSPRLCSTWWQGMGVDPTVVALPALVTLASVISEEWALQPKQRDNTWTENARICGAVVWRPPIASGSSNC